MKKLLIVLAAVALLLSACTINIGTGGVTESQDKNIASSDLPTEDPVEEPYPAVDEEKVDEALNGLWAELNNTDSGTRYNHSWTDGNLFIYIYCPLFDNYLGQMDGFSSEDRDFVVDTAHGFVAGSIGGEIYDIARDAGGENFDIYITLSCTGGICCSSKNLEIFVDRISE